jgi:hypothetical protein
MCLYFGLNNETVGIRLENYFDGRGLSDCDLLKSFNSEADRDPNLLDFIKTIWLILQIPVSESAAEHAFSVPRLFSIAVELGAMRNCWKQSCIFGFKKSESRQWSARHPRGKRKRRRPGPSWPQSIDGRT